jgi:hypothetical protein
MKSGASWVWYRSEQVEHGIRKAIILWPALFSTRPEPDDVWLLPQAAVAARVTASTAIPITVRRRCPGMLCPPRSTALNGSDGGRLATCTRAGYRGAVGGRETGY